jgi:mitogen-activated protein kinase 1/3
MLDLPEEEAPSFVELFPEHSSQHQALDLLARLLLIKPERRISVEAALAHSFMEALHSEDDEPIANMSISFDFESEELTKERVQELIWNEIRDFHPALPASFPSTRAIAKAESKWILEDANLEAAVLSRKRSISPSSK